MAGPFFGGGFFGGGFFGAISGEATVTGGKGDNAGRRRTIFKPTGLVERRAPDVRVEQAAEVHAEVIQEARSLFIDEPQSSPIVQPPVAQPPVQMTRAEVEIAYLLYKKQRTKEDEILLLLLMTAAAAC